MPFAPDPQDAFTAAEFVWSDEFKDKPPAEQEAIKQAAVKAIEERKAGGDILGAIKAAVGIVLPWIKTKS